MRPRGCAQNARTRIFPNCRRPSEREEQRYSTKSTNTVLHGPYAAIQLTVCPTREGLAIDNGSKLCVVRRMLGIGILCEGGDPRGHSHMTDNQNGRLDAQHTCTVTTWKRTFDRKGRSYAGQKMRTYARQRPCPCTGQRTRRLDLLVLGCG